MNDRYVVFEVGCLECIGTGSSEPRIVATTGDLNDAMALVAATNSQGDVDRFAFDRLEMSIAGVSQPESDTDTH